MKDEMFLNKSNTSSSDEILNTLLKSNFDSNINNESLDIDLSACVTISTTALSCYGSSSDFWKTLDLDESAQSSAPTLNADFNDLRSHISSSASSRFTATTTNAAKRYPPPPPPQTIQRASFSLTKPTESRSIFAKDINESNKKKNRRKSSQPKKSDLDKTEELPHPLPPSPSSPKIVKIEKDFTDCLNIDNLESAGVRFKYKCEHCSVLLNSLAEFSSHETSHKIVFKCEECGREFENESGFKKHAKIHRNGVRKDSWQECPDCGKSLKLGSMWMHRKIHSDNKKYGCDICGQKFVQKINLTNHAKVHSGMKPYACPECQKTFPEKSHLIRHQKYHTSTRPYRCEKCGKMYKTERCLKVHNLVHLEQRPFVCQVCNKSFISNSKLKQHSNIHTGLRPYKCNYCARDFTNFPNWLKHTRRRHKVDHKTGELLQNMPTYCKKQKETKTKENGTATAPAATTNNGSKSAATTKKRKKTKDSEKVDATTTSAAPENVQIKVEQVEMEAAPQFQVKKENIFNDLHCLSLTSAEELIMDQALELEESGLFHSDNGFHFELEDNYGVKEFDNKHSVLCSLDSSPFSSPASIELPPYTITSFPSIKTDAGAGASMAQLSSSIAVDDGGGGGGSTTNSSNNYYLAIRNNQTLPSVDILLNATSYLKSTKN